MVQLNNKKMETLFGIFYYTAFISILNFFIWLFICAIYKVLFKKKITALLLVITFFLSAILAIITFLLI